MRTTTTIILLFFCLCTGAEVFTLMPFSGGGKGNPANFLQPADFWTEPVVINGFKTSLRIGALSIGLDVSVKQIRTNYPDAKIMENGNSALIEFKNNDGSKTRIYLVELGGAYPVVQFSMDIPAKIPDTPSWPKELPLPPDSTPVSTIEFPDRKSSYGNFRTSLPANLAMDSVAAQLNAEGWESFGSNNNPMERSNGDVFIGKNQMRILAVSFSENDKGEVSGSAYMKPLK